jgi:RimJ/RimL family protein N-acetyltransferase
MIGIGHWHWHGFGFFMVVERQSGKPIGRVGLIRHSDWPEIELAWHLFEGAEGKGYATEAAIAVKKWAASELGLDRLYSYIDRENTRSQSVARRLGAITDGTLAPHEPEAEIWVHSMENH